jgi:hypothetical protein
LGYQGHNGKDALSSARILLNIADRDIALKEHLLNAGSSVFKSRNSAHNKNKFHHVRSLNRMTQSSLIPTSQKSEIVDDKKYV